jgi:hypothetical protein
MPDSGSEPVAAALAGDAPAARATGTPNTAKPSRFKKVEFEHGLGTSSGLPSSSAGQSSHLHATWIRQVVADRKVRKTGDLEIPNAWVDCGARAGVFA